MLNRKMPFGKIFVLLVLGFFLGWGGCASTPGGGQEKAGQTENGASLEQTTSPEKTAEQAAESIPAEVIQDAKEPAPGDKAESATPDEPTKPELAPEPVQEMMPDASQEVLPEPTPEAHIEKVPESTPENTTLPDGGCRVAMDCPKEPPPIKCLGAHWECVKGKCTPSCGDPKTCDAIERYAKEEKDRIAKCTEDNVCRLKNLGKCPFGCVLPHEWNQSDKRLQTLIGLYDKNKSCKKCAYKCAPASIMSVYCSKKKRCVAVVDSTCRTIKKEQDCLKNKACRAVYGPSCPVCSDLGFRRCVPIEKTGCGTKAVKARSGPKGPCVSFASDCNVPHKWQICP